jgi:hypothetical protein
MQNQGEILICTRERSPIHRYRNRGNLHNLVQVRDRPATDLEPARDTDTRERSPRVQILNQSEMCQFS